MSRIYTAHRGAPATPRSFSTTFPANENPLSEGGLWINGGQVGLDWSDCETTAGMAIGRQFAASYTDATAIIAGAWAANHRVTASVYTVNQVDAYFQEIELRLRTAISAHSLTGYEAGFKCSQTGGAYIILVRWNGALGDFNYLGASGSGTYNGSQYGITTGDVVRAEIVDNQINAYINGVLKASEDIRQLGGTVYSVGRPGIGFNLENSVPGASGTNGDYGITDLTAVDL